MNIKLKWRVSPEPTGRYRSFDTRSWPHADYPNGDTAAMLTCSESYTADLAKGGLTMSGNPPVIYAYVADYSNYNSETPDPQKSPWNYRKLKQEFNNVRDAKDACVRVLIKNPNFVPKEHQ